MYACLLISFVVKCMCFSSQSAPFKLSEFTPMVNRTQQVAGTKTQALRSTPVEGARARFSFESGRVRPLDGCHRDGTKDSAPPKDKDVHYDLKLGGKVSFTPHFWAIHMI